MNLKKVLFLAAGLIIGATSISHIKAEIKVANKTWFPVRFEYHWAGALLKNFPFDWGTSHAFIVKPGETVSSHQGLVNVKTRFIVQIPEYPQSAYDEMNKLIAQAQEARASGNEAHANQLEIQAQGIRDNTVYQNKWKTVYDQPVRTDLGMGNRYIEITTAQTDLIKALQGELTFNVSNSVYLW
jgi:hypothetical protein